MNQAKVSRILAAMEEQDLTQMIISDPAAIFYLTGKWIHPGERMLALYLNTSGNHKLIINRLFPQEKDLGVDLVWYDDTEDAVGILSRYTDKSRPLGIDKTWPAGFLLHLQELKGASSYCNSSTIIDDVRRIKDAEEQQLMREASLANDRVMEQLIPLTGKGFTEKELEQGWRLACRAYPKQDCTVLLDNAETDFFVLADFCPQGNAQGTHIHNPFIFSILK